MWGLDAPYAEQPTALGGLAIWADLQDAVDIPYEAIPHFPRSTVVGQRVVMTSSLCVIVAGSFWFVERLFPTG